MEEVHLYAARVQVAQAMEQGLPWHEAVKRAGVEISQSTAYRLRQRIRQGGEQALREGRHGHPIKLRGEVRQWLEDALPTKQQRSSGSEPAPPRLFHPQRSLLLTLLFLPAVGLHRFWELRSYTGRALALLIGRAHPYSYRHTERFLLRLSQLDGDQVLTDALGR